VIRPLTRRLFTTVVAGGAALFLAAPVPAFAAPGAVTGTVNTGGGPLNVRAGAFIADNILDHITNGRQLTIECQVTGQPIDGNAQWDRLGAGRYVTDRYVSRDRSAPVPACSAPPPPPEAVRAGPAVGIVSTGDGPLNVRAGASTSRSVLDRIPDGSQITIECQTTGASINGTSLWDRIAPGRFVTDAFVRRNGSPVAVCPPIAVDPPPPGVTGTWVVPVPDPVGQGFRPISNPTHDGVDIMEPRYTPIRAASDGTVITMECNTSGPSCNIDGSPAIRGCGWYIEVQHPGQVITRYCHMVRRPEVNLGQHVTTGQILGYVGMSGNTSGPHLHFEVHVGGSSAVSANAVDPIPFMRSVQAPLAGT
jgi:uncharacterized protein YraI